MVSGGRFKGVGSEWPGWLKSEYIVRSVVIGLVAALVGIGFVWWATLVKSTVAQGFLSNIGTAVLTTGVLGIVYEGFLKRGLLDDVRRVQKISQEVIDSGLVQVTTDAQQLDYKEILDDSTEVHIFPQAPLSWAAQNMPWVIRMAIARPIVFRIYVPNPALYATILNSLNTSAAEGLNSRERCAECIRDIIIQWNNAKSGMNRDAKLEIIQYDGYPHSGFTLARGAVVVIAPTAQGPLGDPQLVATVFRGTRSSDARRWAQQTLNNLQNKTIIDEAGHGDSKQAPEQVLPLIDEASNGTQENWHGQSTQRGSVDA